MIKRGWLKKSVATPNGFVDSNGKMLKRRKLDEAFIAEWNGTVAAPEPVVEEVVVEEAPEVEVEIEPILEAPKKKSPAKKKGFFNRK